MPQLYKPAEAAAWLRSCVTGSLFTDSRHVGKGDGFIAWPGAATDGRRFVADVLAAQAAACLVEAEGAPATLLSTPHVAVYAGLKADAAAIAAAYFKDPSRKLRVVAVTGTNGKTSTTWWLACALGRVQITCAMVGTLGIGAPDSLIFNGLTTPDPVLLQQQLRVFVDRGFEVCAIEASSIGIAEQRLNATAIEVAVFTNFTQDHLDYHGSMDAYWEAKKTLFGWVGLKAAVINIDDEKGVYLAQELALSGLQLWTFSAKSAAALQAKNVIQTSNTLSFDVVEGQACCRVTTAAVGMYNVSNLLGVISVMRALGVPIAQAAQACCDLPAVPGRLEMLDLPAQPLVFVDYAHTPDALEKVLMALRVTANDRGGRLWCVFGCGGNRDAAKRPLMAQSAQKNADQIVVTSDNPRGEDPAEIIRQTVAGLMSVQGVQIQVDRAQAIAQTIARAASCDVVLLAGKGHEGYQEIAGVKHAFSDLALATSALDHRSKSGALQ